MKQTPTTLENVIDCFLQRLMVQSPEEIAELFADEIDWFVGGNSALPWTGPRSHRQDVADYFRNMRPHLQEGKSILKLGNVLKTGNDAVVFATFMHTTARTGRAFQTPVAIHLTVADGKIVRMHLYEDTFAVSNAFFKY